MTATLQKVKRSACGIDCELLVMQLDATAGETEKKGAARKFTGKANSGGILQHWYWGQLALDMDGVRINRQDLPVLRDHNPSLIVGYTESLKASKGGLDVQGTLVDALQAGKDAIALLDAGVPLQMSLWFQPHKILKVEAGESVKVNGRTLQGPGHVIQDWTLREVTLTALGADEATGASLLSRDGEDSALIETLHLEQEEDEMSKPNALTAAALVEQHPDAATELRQTAHDEGVAAERARLSFALERAAKCGTAQELLSKAVSEGWDRERIAIEFADDMATRKSAQLHALRTEAPPSAGPAPTQLEEHVESSQPLSLAELGIDASKLSAEDKEHAATWSRNAKLRDEWRGDFELYLAHEKANAGDIFFPVR